VQGASGGIIYDTHQKRIYQVPKSVCQFIDNFEGKSESAIRASFTTEQQEVVTEYIQMLEANEVIHFLEPNLANHFSKLDLTFDLPNIISNCLVDFNVNLDYSLLIQQLSDLRCQAIQIRCFDAKYSDALILKMLSAIDGTSINVVDLVVDWQKTSIHQDLKLFASDHSRLNSVLFYNAPSDSVENMKEHLLVVAYTTSKMFKQLSCGAISNDYFTPEPEHHFESLKHNTCLNKKVSVDFEGNIKNCPSMQISFGKINEVNLEDVVATPEFQKHWNINKDQIKVCKDCEFRHICTDCRAYLEDPADIYSKPLKCGYDPYTGVWEEWSTNPLKEKAIRHYGMQELVQARQQRLKEKE
jgi:SPASM domain peptide maturase of grasp-with-spasm system